MSLHQPAYYAILPANVRYDKDLTSSEKLLFVEITALCGTEGYCWASNKHLAKLFEVSSATVSRWLKNLKENDYIRTEVVRNENKEVIHRKIYPVMDTPPLTSYEDTPPLKNDKTPPLKNERDNNYNILIYNNSEKPEKVTTPPLRTKKTLEERKRLFKETLRKHIDPHKGYTSELMKEFYLYWSEHGESDVKMRFEKEKTFGIGQRLATWLKNKRKFDAQKPRI